MRLSGKARRTRGEFSVQLRYQGSARHMRHHLLREVNSRYNCVIRGVPATCGTTFSGWTGETSSRGWLQFPGTGEGAWSVRINYTGQPMFDGSVTIVGGSWQFHFKNGTSLHGTVRSGGTVIWPSDASSDIGCGNGVAIVNANLSVFGGGLASLSGCLHDLPKGTVIPPKVWGTFNF